MTSWLKVVGIAERAVEHGYKENYVGLRTTGKPQIHAGDHLFLYAAGGSKRIFALAVADGVPEQNPNYNPNERESCRWNLAVSYQVNLPVLAGIPIDKITNRGLTGAIQVGHIRLKDEESESAYRLLQEKAEKQKMDQNDSPNSNTGGGLVEWEDIAEAAARIFNVWIEKQPELEWAKTAWQHLREHGRTRYSTDVDWHVVQCRLLALGGIYRDFCQLAWDESAGKDYEFWAEGMKLDKFTLGRLYQSVENDSTNDDVGMYDAMESIVEAQRPAVVAALQEGFGLEEGLISSLWSTRRGRDTFDSDDGDEIVPETGMSMSKLKALDWILGGCLRLG